MLDKLQTVKIIVNSNLTQTLHHCTYNYAYVFSFSFLSTHLSITQLSSVFIYKLVTLKGTF